LEVCSKINTASRLKNEETSKRTLTTRNLPLIPTLVFPALLESEQTTPTTGKNQYITLNHPNTRKIIVLY